MFNAQPRTSLAEPVDATRYRLLFVDGKTFRIVDDSVDGKAPVRDVSRGPHGFGRLPVVALYGQRRALTSVGASCMGHSSLHIDLFNLVSEARELLRKQTFSQLNVILGMHRLGHESVKTTLEIYARRHLSRPTWRKAGRPAPRVDWVDEQH